VNLGSASADAAFVAKAMELKDLAIATSYAPLAQIEVG
jgi:hypothetical protein